MTPPRAREQHDDGLSVLEVVSMRGLGLPGWYIFKHLEDRPDAIGVVDGPYVTADAALHEAQAMYERRMALSRAIGDR